MPKDEDMRVSRPSARRTRAQRPGAWQAAVIAALSALMMGYWARPGDTASDTAAVMNASRMAEVAAQDEAAALETLSGSREQLAQFEKQQACGRKLAWVTIVRSPGQPPGRIRLQSGPYLSPAFDLTDTPVRVALPYPAPYATGNGSISVVGTTGAIVALTPAWQVSAQGGLHAREVRWMPVGDCPGAGK